MAALKETPVHKGVSPEELLKGITYRALAGNTGSVEPIRMVTSDSREALPGSLFVAVRGYCADGHRFIGNAIKRGSIAVICEELPSETSEIGRAHV